MLTAVEINILLEFTLLSSCVLPGEIISVGDGAGQQQENSIVKITEIIS